MISVIVSAFRNISSLRLVLESLHNQTFNDFEVIIAEDGNDEKMEVFIESQSLSFPIYHLTQEDLGWRRAKILNKAINCAKGEYLVFIEEDCILHYRFLEQHVKRSNVRSVLTGSRVELSSVVSNKLKLNQLLVLDLDRHLMTNLAKNSAEGTKKVDEGVFLGSYWLNDLASTLRPVNRLLASNFSLYKSLIEEINGFDEDYQSPGFGEDEDLLWRLQAVGCQLVSLRNLAVQYHIYHAHNWIVNDDNKELMVLKKQRAKVECLNGIKKMSEIRELLF